ncbi:MAG: hypothetical protein M1436_08405, partial [Acidobacteria bacterium]|nr:hypothetical protein [Acidobacteriota bacterium]
RGPIEVPGEIAVHPVGKGGCGEQVKRLARPSVHERLNHERRLDRTGWISPLIVRITLFDDSRLTLVYPGDLDSCNSLLRHLRRLSRDALIDGIPYRQYWGEVLAPGADRKQIPPPRYRILRPEDEADVERLYQRLKSVGKLDENTDEK